jgi:hypothetical protein
MWSSREDEIKGTYALEKDWYHQLGTLLGTVGNITVPWEHLDILIGC